MTQADLTTVRCADSVDTVITNLENAATAAGLTVFARINHRASAADVGRELRPTELLIFGNPRAGTALMLDQQTAELDLPFSPVAAGNAADHAAIGVAADRYPEAVRAADHAFDLLRDGCWGFRWSVLRFSGWSG